MMRWASLILMGLAWVAGGCLSLISVGRLIAAPHSGALTQGIGVAMLAFYVIAGGAVMVAASRRVIRGESPLPPPREGC